MGKNFQTFTKSSIIVALFSGLIGSVIAIVPAYWQLSIMNSSLQAQRDEIEIMQQSLERKANLVVTVVPYCVWTIGGTYPNGTVKIQARILTLSRESSRTFKIYVSNIGDAFSHLIYYAVFFSCDSPINYEEIMTASIETIVLKPHESTIFEYSFEPSHIEPEILSNTLRLNLTFIVGSVETTIQKVVSAEFED